MQMDFSPFKLDIDELIEEFAENHILINVLFSIFFFFLVEKIPFSIFLSYN